MKRSSAKPASSAGGPRSGGRVSPGIACTNTGNRVSRCSHRRFPPLPPRTCGSPPRGWPVLGSTWSGSVMWKRSSGYSHASASAACFGSRSLRSSRSARCSSHGLEPGSARGGREGGGQCVARTPAPGSGRTGSARRGDLGGVVLGHGGRRDLQHAAAGQKAGACPGHEHRRGQEGFHGGEALCAHGEEPGRQRQGVGRHGLGLRTGVSAAGSLGEG